MEITITIATLFCNYQWFNVTRKSGNAYNAL